MLLNLERQNYTSVSTTGALYVDGVFECFTLEDVVRTGPKVPNRTAIPAGRYKIIITPSQRFRRLLPLLVNVPNFTGVRIHSGNTAEDTEGCILVGSYRQRDFVGKSREAFATLFSKLMVANGDIWIEVKNGGGYVPLGTST